MARSHNSDDPLHVSGSTTGRPLVSAIIPTHNRATLLPKALDSAFAQEGAGEQFDLQVIVVDDASSDSTPEIVRRYPAVRYVRLPLKRGPSAARNAGLAASAGAFVALLDDDDVWLPHRLKAQVPVLQRHPEVGMVYSQAYNSRSGRVLPDLPVAVSGWIFSKLLEMNFVVGQTILARRETFDTVGGFDESLSAAEDWDMWLRLSYRFPVLFVPGVVAIRNQSPQGLALSNARAEVQAMDSARVLEKALQMLPESPQSVEMKRQLRVRVRLAAAVPFVALGEYAQAWARVIATLREHPWIVRHDWARGYVAWVAAKQALDAAAPIAALREVSAQSKAAVPVHRLRERWWVRQMIAGIWAEFAFTPISASASRVRDRDAAYAALCAVAQAPSYLRRKELMRVILRGVLGRRVEALCVGVYRRLKRTA